MLQLICNCRNNRWY